MDDKKWEFETEPTYGTGYAAASVKCPYFRNHGRREIHCDSAYGSDAIQILRFKSHDKKIAHMKIWCQNDYEKCEWYRTMEKMDEDGT